MPDHGRHHGKPHFKNENPRQTGTIPGRRLNRIKIFQGARAHDLATQIDGEARQNGRNRQKQAGQDIGQCRGRKTDGRIFHQNTVLAAQFIAGFRRSGQGCQGGGDGLRLRHV